MSIKFNNFICKLVNFSELNEILVVVFIYWKKILFKIKLINNINRIIIFVIIIINLIFYLVKFLGFLKLCL